MQLSKRMRALASLVTEENRLADIGTDHGYLPIYLVREGKIPSALAMDVNPGPLARAKEHIEAAGLTTYIETRLSDGLQKLCVDEADTILIAGMGGMLTIRILEEGEHCLPRIKELILQPQSDIDQVRRWIEERMFCIVLEEMVEEGGKYYPMMKAVHGKDALYTEEEYYYGRTSLQRSPLVLLAYLDKKFDEAQKIRKRLLESGQEGSFRMQEIQEEMERITRTREKISKKEDVIL